MEGGRSLAKNKKKKSANFILLASLLEAEISTSYLLLAPPNQANRRIGRK